MPDYHKYLMRHGEHGVQDLVERMERYQGIKREELLPLEQRWLIVMLATNQQSISLAA
jgi:hypothetical protein